MMISSYRHRCYIALVAGCLLAPPVLGFVCAPSFRVTKGPTSQLFTSLTVPPPNPDVQGDNDEERDKNYVDNRIQSFLERDADPCFHFRQYLRGIERRFRGSRMGANILDDELERMEVRWYGGEMTPRYTGNSVPTYRGATIQPNVWCYALVANAYEKSGSGEEGARAAEEVMKRCELHAEHDKYAEGPNAVLLTNIMVAWAKADNWDRADEWLQRMEDTYASTKLKKDAPDTVTYSLYIEALATSKKLEKSEVTRKAGKMLDRMEKMAASGENVHAKPDDFTFTAAMKCQPSGIEGAEAKEGLLRRLQDSYALSGDPSLKPKAVVFMPVIAAWAYSKGGLREARRADNLKDELHQLHRATGDRDYLPTESMFTSVMSAYARASREDPEAVQVASERVGELLAQIENDPDIKAGLRCYTTAINAKTQSGEASDADEAEKILRRMPEVDDVLCQCVALAHAVAENAESAERLILEMDEMTRDGRLQRQANAVTHGACIHACAKQFRRTGDLEHVKRADSMLHRVVSLYRDGLVDPRDRKIDATVFARVVQLWSESRQPEAGERGEAVLALLEEMRGIVPNGKTLYRKTPHLYVYLLDAWAASRQPDAASHATRILKQMEEDSNIEPNNRCISSALTSVIRSKKRDDADFAEDLLCRMLKRYAQGDRSSIPNTRLYTNVIRKVAQSGSKDAELRGLNLLHDIRDMHDQNNNNDLAPNAISYGCVLHGLSKKGKVDEVEKLFKEMKDRASEGHVLEKPNLLAYSMVLDAYRNSNRGNPGLAETLLEEVEARHEAGDTSMKPDTQFYNSVMRAMAYGVNDDPKVVEKTENILKKMEMSDVGDVVCTPNLISYTTVCQAYAKSSITDAAEKAEALCRKVEKLAKKGKIGRPDLRFYATVIKAYSRDKKVQFQNKAEILFNHTVNLYNDGQEDFKPNTFLMNRMMGGWATCQTKQKVGHTQSLLERMKIMYEAGNDDVKPNTVSYNWILQAAARSKGASELNRLQSLKTAVDSFKYLHQNDDGVKPNTGTYIYFFRACKSLLSPGEARTKLVNNIFSLACQHGQVSDVLFKQVKELYKVTIENALKAEGVEFDETMEPSDLPASWRRNL